MEKIRYEIDPFNRLVIDGPGDESGLPMFRKVLDGSFKVDKDNNLSYHIKSPLSSDEHLPTQIRIKGSWSLTDNYDLRLTVDKASRETFGDKIILQGEILDARADSLIFAITTAAKENTQSTYVLDLKGVWKADANNRLSFHVKKERGRYDILTFNGAWEVGKNHRIIYRYEKAALIRKKKEVHELIFDGHWDIKDRLRVSYMLGGGTDSVFDFEGSVGVFKEDFIEYEVGISLTDRKVPDVRVVTIFGRWNLKRDVGLVFEVEYENGEMHAIVFGADAKLTDKDTVSFRLRGEIEHQDIGVELELSRRILKGCGEAFLRLLKTKQEYAIYAGAAWRW